MKKIGAVIMCILLILFLSSCMSALPKGEFLSAYDSPDKSYTINIYLCNGNATTDFSIRGELVNNADRAKRNIYWSYHEQEAEVEWIDKETVIINEVVLNVLLDTYDFRRY
jgi:outer membrane lipoprotein-sorting protein